MDMGAIRDVQDIIYIRNIYLCPLSTHRLIEWTQNDKKSNSNTNGHQHLLALVTSWLGSEV